MSCVCYTFDKYINFIDFELIFVCIFYCRLTHKLSFFTIEQWICELRDKNVKKIRSFDFLETEQKFNFQLNCYASDPEDTGSNLRRVKTSLIYINQINTGTEIYVEIKERQKQEEENVTFFLTFPMWLVYLF